MGESLSDESLLERIAMRDPEALEQMYDRYERPMFAFAKQGRQPLEAMENEAWDRVCDSLSTEAVMEHKILGQQLKEAINELQTDQRQVLEWIYYMGYTQQEIADRQQIPLGTVKSRVRLALKHLRTWFDHMWKEGARL
ncbi:RNA polymerase sigma factor [Paenibacillus solisilvae]|uniref:RNA polymerase sigma factor n=1 Tax=Paenibacillus solisilvae TaxID=2486751 RepID=A0ABW0W9C2_9BACL